MIPALRNAFNDGFTPQRYTQFLARLEHEVGTPIHFRVCETPVFLPRPLAAKLCAYGEQLIKQLVGNPGYLEASNVSVPNDYRVPNETATPMFIQVDFGLAHTPDGKIEPKLVELQAFPSLYGYQPVLGRRYIEDFGIERSHIYLSGMDHDSYWKMLQAAVVGEHDPENVVLLEIDLLQQKTLPDFLVTQRQLKIALVDITEVIKEKDRLFYKSGGRLVPIKRIYNRCIVDELVKKKAKLPFDYRDDLQVEWAGHPNWYYRISKFSIPYLQHECVPQTWFLDKIGKLPDDRENYLLKPLYSFAGSGIIFGPTDEQVAAIPAGQRQNFILQERVDFSPVVETPEGGTQAEIRIMYIWLAELTPVLALARLGRGKMMGVDHNKGLAWVGGSVGLWH